MLPSTVISDRSLLLQMACSASQMDSTSCMSPLRRVDLDRGPVGDLPHGVEWTGDDLVTGFQPGEHLEVALAGDADLHRHEHDLRVTDDEDAFRLLPGLTGRRVRRRRRRRRGSRGAEEPALDGRWR